MNKALFITCFFLSAIINTGIVYFFTNDRKNLNESFESLQFYQTFSPSRFKINLIPNNVSFNRQRGKIKDFAFKHGPIKDFNNRIVISETKGIKNRNLFHSTADNILPKTNSFPPPKSFFSSTSGTKSDFYGHLAITDSKNRKLDNDEYYSFYQRILNGYLTQLNLNLFDFIQSGELKKNEEMLAKIVFDKMGHAQNLKIIKWADNDLTQSKFLSALKNIRQIQNPPKGLIKNNETFTVFYGLKIKI